MAHPLRRLAQEGVRFTAVNVVATVLALLIFNLLTHGVGGWFDGPMHARPLSSYLIANSAGMVVSYLGTRHYVFSHRKPMGPLGGAVNYVVINLSSFVIPMFCLWFSRNVLHLDDAVSDNVSGNVVGALAGAVFRFWAFRRFVFRADKVHGEPQHLSGQHARLLGRVLGQVRSVRGGRRRSARPELGPAEPELLEHQPQEGDADPDDVVRITRHS